LKEASDAALASLNAWFQWLAVIGTALGLGSAICLVFVRSETSDRQTKRLAAAHAESQRASSAADRAEREAERLRKAAEDEHLARLQIETKLADRTLSPEQVAQITSAVKRFKGQEFLLMTYWKQREPMALSEAIFQALEDAGWKFIKPSDGSMLFWNVTGIEVHVHPLASAHTKEAALALIEALNKERLGVPKLNEENNGTNPDNRIHVNVAAKP
jgi:hypothetical protein